MSAYGAINASVKPTEALTPKTYNVPSLKGRVITTYPVTGADAPAGVIDYLHGVFNHELEEGKTYPQLGPMTRDEFVAYFFNSTTIVGMWTDMGGLPAGIEGACNGRPWEEAVAGCYYIKPNYPGRSSHNCNAGFIVPHSQRGKKVGHILAESFLHYAPRLGYRASVFNLVYKNNNPSLRLWEKLGFTRAGVIPNAGLLKTGPDGEDEYVDAYIIYKSFV